MGITGKADPGPSEMASVCKNNGEQLQVCVQQRQDMPTVCTGSVWDGVRKPAFFTADCMALCFAFVAKTALITPQGFGYI